MDGAGADCTVMRKWKLLFVNVCECKSQIYTAAVCVCVCVCVGEGGGGVFKNCDSSV